MNTAKDRVVFFDSMADDVCATIRASWCEGLDCTFEAIECVGAAIHCYLERLVVIVPASFAFRHGGLRFRGLRLMPVQTYNSSVGSIFGVYRCADVCYWPIADIAYVAFDVAFGGKADIGYCTAHVRF